MPHKDPAKRRAYERKYAAENPEKRAAIEHRRHQRNLDARRAKSEERNRAAGFPPRPKGAKATPEILVPVSRKWRLFEGRVFFTHKKGFTIEEILDILSVVAPAVKTPAKVLNVQPRAAKAARKKPAKKKP